VSQKDTQFKARALLIHTLMSWHYYKKGDTILESFLKFSAHESAFKIVRWLSTEEIWVFILGVLFSGDVETSQGNTNEMGTAWHQFLDCQVARFSDVCPALLTCRSDRHLMAKFQGDDVIGRIPVIYTPHLSSREFNEFLKKVYHMEFKKEEWHIHSTPWTSIKYQPDGIFYISYLGLKFLKRHFVPGTYDGKRVVIPIRPEKDYWIRVGRSIQDLSNTYTYLGRIAGLMWDTMGTNPGAWRFLSRAWAWGLAETRRGEDGILDQTIIDRVRVAMTDEEFVSGRSFRWNVTINELTDAIGLNGPSLSVVTHRFLAFDPEAEEKYGFRDRMPDRSNIGIPTTWYQAPSTDYQDCEW